MNKRIFSKIFFVVCIKLEHQVTRKAGYITDRIYTLGTRDKHETWPGCSSFDVLENVLGENIFVYVEWYYSTIMLCIYTYSEIPLIRCEMRWIIKSAKFWDIITF
jgi:hypothetical protein